MDIETKNKIAQLENKIRELEDKFKLLTNYSTIPLDIVNAFVGAGFLKYDGNLDFTGGVGGNVFPNIFVKYANSRFLLSLPYPLTSFIANSTTDTCYAKGHSLNDGNTVVFYTTDTLPEGLDSLIETYAIINATADTFQLTTDGINPVDITTDGVGIQYVQPY